MFIINPESLKQPTFKCKKTLGQYLIYHCKIPVLSIQNNIYFFAKTEELQNKLDKLPLIIKLFYK